MRNSTNTINNTHSTTTPIKKQFNNLSSNNNYVNNKNSNNPNDLFNKMSSSSFSNNNNNNNRFNSSNKLMQRHRIKPAELYRTDFITAMKLPDNELLDDNTYWLIKDPWKLDWEKGVQVPVKPEFNTVNCKILKIHEQQQHSPVGKFQSPAKFQITTSGQQQISQKLLNKQVIFKLPKKISVCFKRPIIRPANPRGLHNPSLGR
jgi:hypothetical protein